MLYLHDNLPTIEKLLQQGLPVQPRSAALQEEKGLRIALLNLMPNKQDTEEDFARMLATSKHTIELSLMRLRTHTPRHVPTSHMDAFYRYFDELRNEPFDGFIITGAPLEHMPFENVDYWKELCGIFDWARQNIRSTLYICWAAQAGLYYHFGIVKHPLGKKKFGVFTHRNLTPSLSLFNGIGELFRMPHSRHTEVRAEDIRLCQQLSIVGESDEAGVGIVATTGCREVFITGHAEYRATTLDTEYRRDLAKGVPIEQPQHYYPGDNPELPPVASWHSDAARLYQNWTAMLAERV